MKHLSLIFIISITFFSCGKQEPITNTILVQNYYWAKDGMIDEVYEHRMYASHIRDSLGLAVGRVLLNKAEDGKQAHVIWECEYINEEARKEDIRLLDESGAFEGVMLKMNTLISKFERGVYQLEK